MDIGIQLTQNQTLSHRMIQSAEILQMHSAELNEYLYELSLENPTVDIKESAPASSEFAMMEKYQWLGSQDRLGSTGSYGEECDSDSEEDTRETWNFQTENSETLPEYLWSQLISSEFNPLQNEILKYMLECLDSRGYFTEDTKEIALQFQVECAQVEELLSLLQNLEPAGICARNLSECLLLQLKRQRLDSPVTEAVVRDHLDLVAKNQLPQIARKLNTTMDQVNTACRIIKALNPKPGTCFCDRSRLKYIIPDVTIIKFEGHFDILLNDSLYPDIEINQYYRQICRTSNAEVREYLMKKISQAEWVRQCIAQRNQTLMQVSKTIVQLQSEFFANGLNHMKPLRMQDVAEILNIHESTVSRAARNKYLQCTWGIFPLNFFFSKGIVSKNETGSITSQNIKRVLKDIIENEDKRRPYSDRMLAEILAEQNINISRRTVAKYREQEQIPDTSRRKKFS